MIQVQTDIKERINIALTRWKEKLNNNIESVKSLESRKELMKNKIGYNATVVRQLEENLTKLGDDKLMSEIWQVAKELPLRIFAKTVLGGEQVSPILSRQSWGCKIVDRSGVLSIEGKGIWTGCSLSVSKQGTTVNFWFSPHYAPLTINGQPIGEECLIPPGRLQLSFHGNLLNQVNLKIYEWKEKENTNTASWKYFQEGDIKGGLRAEEEDMGMVDLGDRNLLHSRLRGKLTEDIVRETLNIGLKYRIIPKLPVAVPDERKASCYETYQNLECWAHSSLALYEAVCPKGDQSYSDGKQELFERLSRVRFNLCYLTSLPLYVKLPTSGYYYNDNEMVSSTCLVEESLLPNPDFKVIAPCRSLIKEWGIDSFFL